jgi:hypothetical protein
MKAIYAQWWINVILLPPLEQLNSLSLVKDDIYKTVQMTSWDCCIACTLWCKMNFHLLIFARVISVLFESESAIQSLRVRSIYERESKWSILLDIPNGEWIVSSTWESNRSFTGTRAYVPAESSPMITTPKDCPRRCTRTGVTAG